MIIHGIFIIAVFLYWRINHPIPFNPPRGNPIESSLNPIRFHYTSWSHHLPLPQHQPTMVFSWKLWTSGPTFTTIRVLPCPLRHGLGLFGKDGEIRGRITIEHWGGINAHPNMDITIDINHGFSWIFHIGALTLFMDFPSIFDGFLWLVDV